MKKTAAIVISLILMLSAVFVPTTTVLAEENTAKITYTVKNGKATVSDCDQSIEGGVVIPSTYNGSPITAIADSAFQGCQSITSVKIPNTVTKIGMSAFAWCTGLKKIVIPDSVKTVGEYAFLNCYNAETLKIGAGLKKIGVEAFAYCGSLTKISMSGENEYFSAKGNCLINAEKVLIKGTNSSVIPEDGSVTAIGPSAFANCKKLKSVEIPYGVKTVDNCAFMYCTALKKVMIPSSVKTIGYDAFYDCKKLKSVVLPDSIKSLGTTAFAFCESLEEVTLSDNIKTVGYRTFGNCSSLKIVKFGNKVTRIDNEAFYGCSALEGIELPANVAEIAYSAFTDCGALKTVAVPKSLKKIGDSAFAGCSELDTVVYEGTKTNWKSLTVELGNSDFEDADVEYSAYKTVGVIKLAATQYSYTGKAITPKVVVKSASGKTLKKNVDYKVKYQSGRKNVGVYRVRVTMLGKYKGTKLLYFTVKPANTSVKKLTPASGAIKVAVNKKTKQVSGYEIQYATKKSFSNAEAVKTSSATKTVKNLKSKKTYYVRARTYKKVGSVTYYSDWSSIKKAKTK